MLTSVIENLLNRNLGASTRARELCRELRGQRLRITLLDTPWIVSVESLGPSLRIQTGDAGSDPAEASIEGTVVNLLALAGAESPEAVVQRGAVRISGDPEIAQKYRQMALLLRPDFEEELSGWFGDAAAHRLARFAQGIGSFARRATSTAVQNSAEYLAHERRDLVPRAEAAAQFESIDRLREDVDRFEARLRLLAGGGAEDQDVA